MEGDHLHVPTEVTTLIENVRARPGIEAVVAGILLQPIEEGVVVIRGA